MTTLIDGAATQVDFCCEEFVQGGVTSKINDPNSYLEVPIAGLYLVIFNCNLLTRIGSSDGNQPIMVLHRQTTGPRLNDPEPGNPIEFDLDMSPGASPYWEHGVSDGTIVCKYDGVARVHGNVQVSNGTTAGPGTNERCDCYITLNDFAIHGAINFASSDNAEGRDYCPMTAYVRVQPGDKIGMRGQDAGSVDGPNLQPGPVMGSEGYPHTYLAAEMVKAYLSCGFNFTATDENDQQYMQIPTPALEAFDHVDISVLMQLKAGTRVKMYGFASGQDIGIANAQLQLVQVGPYKDPTFCAGSPPV